MKSIFKLKNFAYLLLVVFISSCGDDDGSDNPIIQPDDPDPVTEMLDIAGTALATDDLSTLVEALMTTQVLNTVQEDGPFTVFAPNNAAFAAFLSDNGFATLDDVPEDLLTQVLLNHVVVGENFSTDLSTGYINSSSTAGVDEKALSLFVNTSSGVTINGSEVLTADIEATNGVVHIVDQVIGLPTVVDHALNNPELTTLVDALTSLTPSVDFVGVLSAQNGTGDDPFTVFAPTNDAFDALAAIPDEDGLIPILQFHVIAGANISSGDLTADGTTTTPATLEGGTFDITLPGTNENIADIVDGAGNNGIGIDVVDIQAVNGVVHVVDTVLMPGTDN